MCGGCFIRQSFLHRFWLLYFFTNHQIVLFSTLSKLQIFSRNSQRKVSVLHLLICSLVLQSQSWKANVLQSLSPTAWEFLVCLVRPLISWFRCVSLGLELNSAGAGLDSPSIGGVWKSTFFRKFTYFHDMKWRRILFLAFVSNVISGNINAALDSWWR